MYRPYNELKAETDAVKQLEKWDLRLRSVDPI